MAHEAAEISPPHAGFDAFGRATDAPGMGRWDRLSLGAVHAAVSLILAIGSVRGLWHFGRCFGYLEYLINYKRRRRFAAALGEICGPDVPAPRRRAETRAYFMNARCDRLFYLVLDRVGIERAKSLFHVVGREHLDAALARGRGVYVALSHFGPHHIIAVLFALLGYRTAMVRDPKEGPLRRFVQDRLHRKYPELGARIRVLFTDTYPREIYRLLEDGFILGSALDIARVRDPRQRMHKVRLFGTERPILAGPLRIALKTNVPVLQAMIAPLPGGRYELEFMSPLLDPAAAGAGESALGEALQTYARRVESYVRDRPHLITRI